jgi:RING-type zinc-finger
MAAAADLSEQLNKILQCSICIDVFTDPRALPCLHTFCFKCIADWCKDKQRKGKVTCPECREEFVIPDSGVDGIKKNFFIANMLSINDVEQKTGDLCEICVVLVIIRMCQRCFVCCVNRVIVGILSYLLVRLCMTWQVSYS